MGDRGWFNLARTPPHSCFSVMGFCKRFMSRSTTLVVGKSFSGAAGDEHYFALRTAAILRSSERGCQRLTSG